MTTKKSDHYLDLLSESLAQKNPTTSPRFSVSDLLSSGSLLELSLAAGEEGLDRLFATPKVQLLGLALAGFTDDLEAGSAQILGRAELRYIRENIAENPPAFFDSEFNCDLTCFVVPDNLEIPEIFIKKANEYKIPVLHSPKTRLEVGTEIVRILERELAPRTSFHGDLVVVCGIGILILGKSGIGKSDCALDLITHGHQLVADDIVFVRKNLMGQLVGKSREPVRHHMDIRGLGIVNIKELFSIYSVMDEHTIDMILFLEPWREEETYAVAPGEETVNVLGIVKPLHRLPVTSGRNWVNLIQVAVRNHILKAEGHHTEQILDDKLNAIIGRKERG